MIPRFQKLLTRRHSTLTDDIILCAWNDKTRFETIAHFPDYVQNLEILNGEFWFDQHWIDSIMTKYSNQNPIFFWDFTKRGYLHGDAFTNFARHLKLERATISQLQKYFFDSVLLMKNLLVFLPETHPLVKIIEQKVIAILKTKGVGDQDLNEALLSIAIPKKANGAVLESRELREIAMEIKENKTFDLNQALDEHTNRWAFLGYREPFSSGYTRDFFFKRLEELKPTSQTNEPNRSKSFLPEEQVWVDLLQEFVFFRNYRTEKLYEGLFCLEKLWDRLDQYYELSPQTLGYYRLYEIQKLFDQNLRVPQSEIDLRKQGYGFLLHDDIATFLTGKELESKKNSFEEKTILKELKGMSACGGIARGPAKIIFKASEQDQILEGDILITPMTTPDFLPSMKRAAAFVTDEGGITCHAAIVAREMGKPCLIGTKQATQLIKNRDLVEVNANKGIVKIL